MNKILVQITPLASEYADVAAELILEDALRVNPHGWPQGFQFDVQQQGTMISTSLVAKWLAATAPAVRDAFVKEFKV